MLDGRRKSIQPMAGRLPDGNMQALQQFMDQSPWDPLPIRRRIAARLSGVVRPEVWVIDDVSFPKCGKTSVGVARQYCGAVGKRANCQVAVSVHAATDTASCPLDWELYLPREWTDEPDRCRRAGVPDDVVHREKWRLALGLLDTLAQWRFKAPVVVADAGYGVSTPFRLDLQERGLSYVLALNGREVAHPEDAEPHRPACGGLGPPTLPSYRTGRPAFRHHLDCAERGRHRLDIQIVEPVEHDRVPSDASVSMTSTITDHSRSARAACGVLARELGGDPEAAPQQRPDDRDPGPEQQRDQHEHQGPGGGRQVCAADRRGGRDLCGVAGRQPGGQQVTRTPTTTRRVDDVTTSGSSGVFRRRDRPWYVLRRPWRRRLRARRRRQPCRQPLPRSGRTG